ncbi:MAG: ShlB/FhaC/HecB family hemolysin secretion/activation protein [Xanthobacteraceae bacterium]
MQSRTWLLSALALVSLMTAAAEAQVIPPGDLPGRERQRFIQPAAPQAQPGGPVVTLPSTVAPEGADKVVVLVAGVEIGGSTVYGKKQLAELYTGMVGQRVPLTAVYALAHKITSKYGNDGYVLSRAIVPPQQLSPDGAVVHIDVVEGYIDKVEWPRQLARYRDFFTAYAAKITAQRPVNIRTIERYLLLAGDLPGLKFKTSLRPSETARGAATLVVEVAEKRIDANAHIDNRGTQARGPFEYYGSATLNNLFGQHEAWTFTYAGVVPLKELNYAALGYKQALTSEGLTFFADGSDAWGTPGTVQLESLLYRTLGPYGDAGFSYPVLRSREKNITLSSLVYGSDNESDALGAPLTDDRLRGFRSKVDADFADQWHGINQFNVTFSQGIQGLGSTSNNNPLASRLAGRVDYDKIEATAARNQALFDQFSAYVSLYGQYAGTPLLVPEQCGFGGRYFGRAFDPSQLLGDSCFETVGELRYDLPAKLLHYVNTVQFYGYTDYGDLYTRDATPGTPQVPGTPKVQHAASVGGGVRLDWFDHIDADLSVAKAIEGPINDTRFFFILSAHN